MLFYEVGLGLVPYPTETMQIQSARTRALILCKAYVVLPLGIAYRG